MRRVCPPLGDQTGIRGPALVCVVHAEVDVLAGQRDHGLAGGFMESVRRQFVVRHVRLLVREQKTVDYRF